MEDNCKIIEIDLKKLNKTIREIDVKDFDKLRIRRHQFPLVDGEICSTNNAIDTLKFPITVPDMIQKLKTEYNIRFFPEEVSLAEDFFSQTNYYRFSIFMKFIEFECHFTDLLQIYEFDTFLRDNLLSLINTIEIYIKTTLAYTLSNSYSDIIELLGKQGHDIHPSLVYLDNRIYKSAAITSGDIEFMLSDIAGDMYARKEGDLMIQHHMSKYGGYFPFWVIIEQMTLGKVSTLIMHLERKVRKYWSDLNFIDVGPKDIPSWINAVLILRNICAHGGRLYGRRFTYSPAIRKNDKIYFDNQQIKDEDRYTTLFSGLLVMKNIYSSLSDKDIQIWEEFLDMLEDQISERRLISLKRMGFHIHWKSALSILNCIDTK